MKVTQLNKPILQKFRQDFMKLTNRFAELSTLENVSWELGNCSFNPDEATFKLVLRVDGAKTTGQKDLEFWSKLEGVDPKADHPIYELLEYNIKGRKYPWIYKHKGSEGRYKATTQWAKANFPAKGDWAKSQQMETK
tara:strand:- start:7778 stop:8188 length:411 start_codon:yes stop_codon:yes gene_type:complete